MWAVVLVIVCPITCISRPSTTTKCWPVGLAAYSEWICVHLVVCGVITLVALVFFRSTSCCSASSQPPEGLFRVSKSMWLSTGIRPRSKSRRQFLIVHSRVGLTFSNCQGQSGSRWGGRYFYNHFINQIITVQCTLDISQSLVHNWDRMPKGHPISHLEGEVWASFLSTR